MGEAEASGGVVETESTRTRIVLQRFAGGVAALGGYHVHHKSDNIWLVLSGILTAVIGGVRFEITAGDAIFMPADVPHATGNYSAQEVTAFEVYNPSIYGVDGGRDAEPSDLPETILNSAPPHTEGGVRVWDLDGLNPDFREGGQYPWRTNVRLARGGITSGYGDDRVSEMTMILLQRFAGGAQALGGYHVHHDSDNIWVVTQGVLTSVIDGVRYRTEAGEAIFMPANLPHATGNFDEQEMHAFEIYAPTVHRADSTDDSHPVELPSVIVEAAARA